MENLQKLLSHIMSSGLLTQGTLSNVRKKDPKKFTKVKINPLIIKNEIKYQFTYQFEKQVTHENLSADEAENKILSLLEFDFKQGLLQTRDQDYQVLVNKKGQATILQKKATKTQAELSHNRKKNYLLEEGTPVPFLVELGVMNEQGKVLSAKYDKFRQINRFLEMIDDVVPYLQPNRRLNIVDFGCGKSYLTFAMYHYLTEIKRLDLNVIGLDLKEEVICHCNELTEKLEYRNLKFLVGDISQYNGLQQVDMVVTLHACDTATDAALEKAVRWGADVILSVPCCQHEMFSQIKNDMLSPMLNHGIIKERFAALATDSVRAHILSMVGYKTQILEFIDLEHTPKNLLIRAVKQATAPDARKLAAAYLEFKRSLNISPYLEIALEDILNPLLKTK